MSDRRIEGQNRANLDSRLKQKAVGELIELQIYQLGTLPVLLRQLRSVRHHSTLCSQACW